MINVASIRAAAATAEGDDVGISKAQLDQLLDELEEGQRAKRELRMIDADRELGVADPALRVSGGYRPPSTATKP